MSINLASQRRRLFLNCKLQLPANRYLKYHFAAGAAPSGFMISPRKVFFKRMQSKSQFLPRDAQHPRY